jgi:hypothetical protein
MAAPMQTFQLNSHYSIFRRILNPRLASQLGSGSYQVRRQWPRPLYEFVVHDTMAVQSSAEYIYSFATYHGGDIPFWWNGGPWGAPQTHVLVGFGNGAQTQFFLPNRYITPNMLDVTVNGVSTALTVMDWASGLMTFGSPVPDQAEIRAQYVCTYKCLFWFEDMTSLTEEQFYSMLFRYEGIIIRECVP